MTDNQELNQPVITDPEALHEFYDALVDRVLDIERDISILNRDPNSREVISNIFRALHNIKGDAALCSLPMAGLVAHPLESLVTRLRSEEIHYTELLGEVILLTLDRLELAVEALLAGRPVFQLNLVLLVEGLEQISKASQSNLELSAAQLIKAVTGFQPQATLRASISVPSVKSKPEDNVASDLQFFRTLSLQFETHSPRFSGRTDRLHQLVLDTNRMAGLPVDEVQLEAALYLHDVGMMFLPEAIWLKVEKMSDEERAILRSHPGFAAGLLDRMKGWESAAEMVRQHHEKRDGKGYPAGLKEDEICKGAKILALADAFEAVMLKHSARSHSSSILRAIAEITPATNSLHRS